MYALSSFFLWSLISVQVTGEPLVQRQDDSEDIFKNRMKQFMKETSPLLDYYSKKGLLSAIDSSLPAPYVYAQLRSVEEFHKTLARERKVEE